MSTTHPILPLTLDELLTTTRAVRKRLDVTRPVERSVLEECLRIAQQAPSASNRQNWHFIVVTDQEKRHALGEIYRKGRTRNQQLRLENAKTEEQRQAVFASGVRSNEFAKRIHEVPVLVIPCVRGRTEHVPYAGQAALWGSITPAAWNFMLALRSRGLGSVWTTIHLHYEQEAAELLGIPYENVMQAALIPVAYTIGTEFKPSRRGPLEEMVHWEGW